jgi:hypothetical protein
MNLELGNQMDEPQHVAEALLKQIKSVNARSSVGLAENFFAKLNALFPSVVGNTLSKKLTTIG